MGMPRLKAKDSNTKVMGAWCVPTMSLTWLRKRAGRIRLVSMTKARSRNSANNSRSCSMASTKARLGSTDCTDKGCERRVSEKRRTKASVVASKNSVVRCTGRLRLPCKALSWRGTPGRASALRTSMAMATRLAWWLCSREMKASKSSGGRLSTQ